MIDSLRRVLVYGIDYLDTLYDHIDPDVAAVLQMIAAYDALAPDWSQAPEWAQWYAIDADGTVNFHSTDPTPVASWYVSSWESGAAEWAGTVSIPLGIDWRLLKWQRPEVTP